MSQKAPLVQGLAVAQGSRWAMGVYVNPPLPSLCMSFGEGRRTHLAILYVNRVDKRKYDEEQHEQGHLCFFGVKALARWRR